RRCRRSVRDADQKYREAPWKEYYSTERRGSSCRERIDETQDISRDGLRRVWSCAFRRTGREARQFVGTLDQSANRGTESIECELRLRNVNRRAGLLQRDGVRRLVV